jgi:hypothetical protein
VLSQVDGMVAFRLTASQDRKALGMWIEGHRCQNLGRASGSCKLEARPPAGHRTVTVPRQVPF